MHAAGDEVVARAFGSGPRHEGCLDLQKAVVREVVADGARDLMPEAQVALHLRPAQVEIAVLEPHLFVRDGVFSRRERRGTGIVQEQQLGGDELDVTSGHVRVYQRRVTPAQRANGGDDILRPRGLGAGVGFGAALFIQHHLGDAGAVANVQKDEVAVVAAAVDPGPSALQVGRPASRHRRREAYRTCACVEAYLKSPVASS